MAKIAFFELPDKGGVFHTKFTVLGTGVQRKGVDRFGRLASHPPFTNSVGPGGI